jgi:hypothetical protein
MEAWHGPLHTVNEIVVNPFKIRSLLFAVGVSTAMYVLLAAGQDQIEGFTGVVFFAILGAYGVYGSSNANLAVAAAGIVLNGFAFVTIGELLRRSWSSTRWLSLLFATLVGAWVVVPFALSGAARSLRPETETVMTPGMRVVATTPHGPLTISAGRGTRRSYSGSGWNKSLALIARTSRWYGSLGLYDPAESFSPYGRVLPEEGQMHFPSVAQTTGWLHELNVEAGTPADQPIYTNNGLVLCYSVDPIPGTGVPTVHVALWQVYIDGHRPNELPGANDSAIRVEGGAIPDSSTVLAAQASYRR